jgi:hypothetical protein
MKLLSLAANDCPSGSLKFFLFSPVPSIRTWNRSSSPDWNEKLRSGGILLGEILLLVGFYTLPGDVFLSRLHWYWQSYLALIPFLLLVDSVGRLCRIGYGFLGIGVPNIHEQFYRAETILGFWSQWNVWFYDFFRETCFRPLIRWPRIGLLTVFLGSGILHEYLVNLPLFWLYREALFGTMLLYFLLQFLGILVQKNWNVGSSYGNRLFTAIIVLVPVPLVINLGTLRIFHLGFFGA